jgi:hypothetical protein
MLPILTPNRSERGDVPRENVSYVLLEPRVREADHSGDCQMNRCRRSFLFVDREVQGALMLRAAIYWLFCLISISLMLIGWSAYAGPPRRFIDLATDVYFRYGPAMAASLVLLPLVLIDVVRMSNRFVGPVVRLRGALRELADGRPAQPLNFRDDDFWREMATDFNKAAARCAREAMELSRPTEAMPVKAEEETSLSS